jgi:predicted transcriptional regulator
MHMRVGELHSREVCSVEPGEPRLQALRQMHRQHVGSVVAVERHAGSVRPAGMVTDRDVMRGEIAHLGISPARAPAVFAGSG